MSIKLGHGGNFELIRPLNGDDTVLLARDTASRKNVVLREVGGSLDIYKRILRFPHENVETVQRIVRVRNGYIAVCGFCAGVTLRELMENDAAFVKVGIVQIAEQICDAAEHLHKLGLVHRDITPNNIIVDTRSLKRKADVTLIDFDISRIRYGGKEHDTSLFGTAGYAAPEQYGFSETDFRTDIYAVGRVIGDMLKVCEYPEEMCQMWEHVIEKCTMYSPNDRYGSYEIMKKDVVRIWQYRRALLAAALGRYGRALKIIFFGEKKRGDIEDDFLII